MADIILALPACSVRCRDCYLSCATIPDRVDRWRREIDALAVERRERPDCWEVTGRLDVALVGLADALRDLGKSPRPAGENCQF